MFQKIGKNRPISYESCSTIGQFESRDEAKQRESLWPRSQVLSPIPTGTPTLPQHFPNTSPTLPNTCLWKIVQNWELNTYLQRETRIARLSLILQIGQFR